MFREGKKSPKVHESRCMGRFLFSKQFTRVFTYFQCFQIKRLAAWTDFRKRSRHVVDNSFFIISIYLYRTVWCVLSIKRTRNISKQSVYPTRTISAKNTNYTIHLYCSILKLLDNSIETNFHFSNYCGYWHTIHRCDPIKEIKPRFSWN